MGGKKKLNPLTVAVIFIAITIVLNVYGFFSMPEVMDVGGIFSATGEVLEMPTLMILGIFLALTVMMSLRMGFDKHENSMTAWMVMIIIIIAFNAFVVFTTPNV